MTVTYTKAPRVPAVHRWANGVVATTMNWSRGFPHDLRHWIMEAQVDLPWGFWALAGQQAPFDSFHLVSGRWPKGRREWLDRVRRKHRLSMLHAEAHDGYWLADPELEVRADWPVIRRRLARTYAFSESPLARLGPEDVERLRPFARRAVETWDVLPEGGGVQVSWPGTNYLVVLSHDDSNLGLRHLPPRSELVRPGGSGHGGHHRP